MSAIEYFYSAHSAYAYFGSRLFMEIATKAGRRIDHRPVDLNKVLAGCGSVAFRDRPLGYRNYFFNREMERWIEYRGIRGLGYRPTTHHHSPDLANKMLIAGVTQEENVDALAHAMLEGHWAEDADLADEATLLGLAAAVGLDGGSLLKAAKSDDIAATYQANTDEAIERSVFGSPTYFIDGDMFYGQDRLELVARALERPFASEWPQIPA